MKSFGRLFVLGLIIATISAVLHHGNGHTATQQQAQSRTITTTSPGAAMRAYMEQIRPGLTPCIEGSLAIGQGAQALKDGTGSLADILKTADGLTGACDTAASTMDGTAIPSDVASSRTFQLYLALTKDGVVLVDKAVHDFAAADSTTPDISVLSHAADEYAQSGTTLEHAHVYFAKMQHDWHFTVPTVTG